MAKRGLALGVLMAALVSCSVSYEALGRDIDATPLPDSLVAVGETHVPPATCVGDECPYLDRWYLSPESPETTCDLIKEWGEGKLVEQTSDRVGTGFCAYGYEHERSTGIFIEVLSDQTMIPPEDIGGSLRAVPFEHGAVVKVGASQIRTVGSSQGLSSLAWFADGSAMLWFTGMFVWAVAFLAVALYFLRRRVTDPMREAKVTGLAVLLLGTAAVVIAVFLFLPA